MSSAGVVNLPRGQPLLLEASFLGLDLRPQLLERAPGRLEMASKRTSTRLAQRSRGVELPDVAAADAEKVV